MKPKAFLFGFAVISLLLAFSAVPAAAAKPVLDPLTAPYLVAKNMAAGWVEVPDLGIGHFTYTNRGADLRFSATNLSGTPAEYALISYREPATESDFLVTVHTVLKTGRSDRNGNITMKIGTGSFLNHLICNAYAADAPGDYQDITGAKVWLVPVSDLALKRNGAATFTAWNPDTYLFESDLITQTCQRRR